MATFKDLYDYIQTAKRDEVGMHDFWEDKKYEVPHYYLHIYQGRQQVNLDLKKTVEFPSYSIANFVFRDGDNGELEVACVNVNNGTADYDNMVYIPADEVICRKSLGLTIRDNIGLVDSVLRDLLAPIYDK